MGVFHLFNLVRSRAVDCIRSDKSFAAYLETWENTNCGRGYDLLAGKQYFSIYQIVPLE